MDTNGLSRADLARAAGVTEAAVTFWMDGSTQSLKGNTAARLEQKTGFRAAWLSTGKGQKLLSPSEKDDMLLPREVELIEALRMLTEEEQAKHHGAILEAARHNQAVLDQHMKRLGIPAEPRPKPSPKRKP